MRAGPQRVRFQDIGLDAEKEYIVFEFWTDHMLGVFQGAFEAPEIGPKGLHSFAIRNVSFDGQAAEITRVGASARVAFLPQATDSVGWSIQFKR